MVSLAPLMRSAGRGRVLVVDDQSLNRLIIGRMLVKLGLEVMEAENGQVALDMLSEGHKDVACILLDLQMPVLDGWQMAEELRRLEQEDCRQRMPIVACTALSAHAAASALDSGVDELMEKPPSMPQLLRVLSKYISDLQQGRPRSVSEPGSSHSSCSSDSQRAVVAPVSIGGRRSCETHTTSYTGAWLQDGSGPA